MAAEGLQVLVIEDDAPIGRLVTLILGGAGFQVTVESEGESGIAFAEQHPPDVILLDLTLPMLSGQDTLAILSKHSQAPVLILTAGNSQEVLVECLQFGAFDVVLKPFDPDDLETSVRLALNMGFARSTDLQTLKSADAEIDFTSFRCTRAGKVQHLSHSEWRLLELLASKSGEPILYQELLGRVWGPQFRNHLGFLRAWMSRLQQKVEIAEFHDVGYALVI